MKFDSQVSLSRLGKSRPARGGWIEITRRGDGEMDGCRSRPARGGWIEIFGRRNMTRGKASPAPHGAGGLKS